MKGGGVQMSVPPMYGRQGQGEIRFRPDSPFPLGTGPLIQEVGNMLPVQAA